MPIVWGIPSHEQGFESSALRDVPPRRADVADAQGGENKNPEVVEVV